MTKLAWDANSERLFETGVSRGVLFPMDETTTPPNYGAGVAWNGLTAVTESPSGAEATALYADNIKYLSLTSAEEFGATIEAYMYPDAFAACDGTAELDTDSGVFIGQQDRKLFGFCYTTQLGNDVLGNAFGKKIHIIYGAKAAPSERGYATINDAPEAITFSWAVTTTAVEVPGFKPTATLIIDGSKVSAEAMSALEDYLYGAAADETATPPKLAMVSALPMPAKVLEIIATADLG